jgi:hypothetical protein
LSVWDDFRIKAGFNLIDVLAPLELVPFVRIPTEISKAHGSAETISLFKRLEDAQRAFVFGCYLACAALQRAILEDMLPPGARVPPRINSADIPLPLKSRLHEINQLARDALHADRRDKMERVEMRDLLMKLVRGLHTLKELIEMAPIRRMQP